MIPSGKKEIGVTEIKIRVFLLLSTEQKIDIGCKVGDIVNLREKQNKAQNKGHIERGCKLLDIINVRAK